ncbi:R2-like ligand-binding oxidase [Bacillus sp. V3B]|uniref:R2-like ligand-binding oxidase n=1 Tax=Bacillus sp. V3B TaxID=2804915 RepID=UPI00210E3CB3|nr:R2-like ligand-binding oxidase [Bacillus sp. V3B]MCQ6275360.1 R2-like ligand-binding oxidase [Bacillus sp. V3B]
MRTEIMSLTRGIDKNSFPYQLYQRAKQFGIWDPSKIDFSQDKEDWKRLSPETQETIKIKVSRHLVGEEAVTMDILPMIMACAKKGWLEEEMYLTTFVFEEAKHVEMFRLFMDAIGEPGDINYSTGIHRETWFETLPTIMNRLIDDATPQNMAEAAAIYNIYQEGIQAETSYYTFTDFCKKNNVLPGLLEGIRNLQHDESRHISFGNHILHRLITEEDPEIYHFVENKIRNEWWPITEYTWGSLAQNGGTDGLGMKIPDMLAFARKQLEVRLNILKKSYDASSLREKAKQ